MQLQNGPSRGAAGMTLRVACGSLNATICRSAYGAQRKHVTLPTDFRSPSVNGHSCYGHLTARFAPNRPFAATNANRRVGWKADAIGRPRAHDRVPNNLKKLVERRPDQSMIGATGRSIGIERRLSS